MAMVLRTIPAGARVLTPAEVRASGHYDDLADLAEILGREIVAAPDGPDGREVWRWRRNELARRLCDTVVDLNSLWLDLCHGRVPLEDVMGFYADIGYSLCGYAEVFGQREAAECGLPGAAGDESLIDYVIRTRRRAPRPQPEDAAR